MTLVTRADIEKAATSLKGVSVRTPLIEAPWLSEQSGAIVRLKCENLQRAGAFKLRGAYTMIARLTDTERKRGVITFSSGNHGQGVALAARIFGIRAVVVMPVTAPAIKVEGARNLGADVVLEGTTSTERQKRALALAEEHGYVVIPPFDHPDIIAGQGTVALEILEDWPDVEVIFAPIGGGGLASGIAAYVKQVRAACRVIGVEPETADAMYQSIEAHHPVTIAPSSTIADGLMPVRPGDLTYEHVAEYMDEIIRVPDAAIRAATAALIRTGKMIVEFSGAATVAALLQEKERFRGAKVAAVLSGGNLDPSKLAELIAS